MPPPDTYPPPGSATTAAAPVVPCAPALRAEARRELALRLERATAELAGCVVAAREVDLHVNARRIEGVRFMCAELVLMLKEDAR